MTAPIPDPFKTKVGKTAVIIRGRDQPLVPGLHVSRRGNALPLGVRRGHEMFGENVVAPLLALVRVGPFPAVAEEIKSHAGQGGAGGGVGQKEVGAPIQRFAHDDRVIDPDHDLADVAVLHAGGQKVGARLLQRRLDRDAPVKMHRARLQGQIPAGDLGPDVLGLVFVDQPVADVANIDPVPL